MKEFTPNAKIRLLLFDLDNTLLDSRKRISGRNLSAVAECRGRGIIIGVATARSESTCARFTDILQPDLLISSSGALVRLRGEVIFRRGFTAEESAAIIGAGLAENRGITVDCEDATYSNRDIDFFNDPGIRFSDLSDFSGGSFKICIEGTDVPFAERTAALIDGCSWQPFSDCDWFKFSKNGVSKGDALRQVVSATGIPAEEMAAFGDDLADIEMLDFCGAGIAMGNAIEEVKRHADTVIGDNNSDAIADFLDYYIL